VFYTCWLVSAVDGIGLMSTLDAFDGWTGRRGGEIYIVELSLRNCGGLYGLSRSCVGYCLTLFDLMLHIIKPYTRTIIHSCFIIKNRRAEFCSVGNPHRVYLVMNARYLIPPPSP
jgi:hypothetical protein